MFYSFLTFLFIISGTPVRSSQLSGKKYVRVVYLQSDSTERTDFEKYDIDLIPKEYVTHIIYAFASLNRTTYEDIVLNHKDQLKKVLRYQRYGIKCMIGFGGWGDSFNDYPKMLNVEEKRNRFAEKAAKFVAENGLDGFDMDLEYPCCWRGNCDYRCSDDRVNFTRLMELIRKHLDQLGELYGKRFLLTAAVSPFVRNIPIIYEVKKLNSLVDYIHVMTYELHNAYSGRLGNAAPFTAQGNDRNSRELNVVFIMDKWLSYGASPEKLTIGIPFFSKSFRLFRKDLHCTGDLALGTSSIGDPAYLKARTLLTLFNANNSITSLMNEVVLNELFPQTLERSFDKRLSCEKLLPFEI